MNEVLSGLSTAACIVYDILVYVCGSIVAKAQIDHDKNLVARDKMKLNCSSAKYIGHVLTSDGLKVTCAKSILFQRLPTGKESCV